MADDMFNNGRGRLRQAVVDGSDLIMVLLKAAEADAALQDHDTLDVLLAAAGNTEADFTNYARKVIANANITATVDDTNERLDVDIPDQTFASAGGATDNTLAKVIICIDGASDAARIPITHHDFTITTDGNDVNVQIPTSPDGFYQSS